MRFQSLFLVLIVLFASVATNQALNINRRVNVSDPQMIDIAKFTVTEHNKQVTEAKLKFEKLLGGLTDETVYILAISANNGSASNIYDSLVYESPPNHFNLKYFHIRNS
ncbi:putative Cystatin domain-containing protein [Medicago truncatula]|uniref:Cysteine proteinase inhibitor 5 n=1 Tax=Medicago truncatula TaxID=3880 RepID=A0A072UHZ8_MEDTR|nr:cysteine proteinase inhibitor 5 [Medicago truncatula]KEH25405.1 cysteine proteinase inhibitor 5 [Medicago truncatula]RHN50540.1 putative Cystatin domain-containing protein [Medicago truncatula]